MIMEAIVSISCAYGNNESCMAGLDKYVKYNKLDTQAQIIEENVKKKYPSLHLTGTILSVASQKKYNFMIYRDIWYNGDYSDNNNQKNMIIFKYYY